jgi:hypothetical protein
LIADVMHEQNRNLDSPEIKLTQAKANFVGPAARPKQSRRQYDTRQSLSHSSRQSSGGDRSSARANEKYREPGKPLAQIPNHSRNIGQVIRSQSKIVAHAAALVIRRRIHDDCYDSALDEFSSASDQKVIGAEFNLAIHLAQPDETAGAGKQESYRLWILW